MKTKFIFIMLIFLLLAGCSAPSEQIVTITAENTPAPAVTPVQTTIPAAEIIPTITEEPMQTPTITSKPKATPTPEPTAAPTLTSVPTAEPTPNPTAEPANDKSSSDFGGSILALVNSHRNASGLGSLKYSSAMQQAADTRAKECAQSFSHSRPDGAKAHTALTERGISFTAFGENLFMATGMSDVSAEYVVEQWMSSSGHRQNIMQEMFTHMCIGVASKGNEIFVVQLFGAGIS